MEKNGEKVLEKYTMLEGFKYKLPKFEFKNKWRLFGATKEIYDRIEVVREELETKKLE